MRLLLSHWLSAFPLLTWLHSRESEKANIQCRQTQFNQQKFQVLKLLFIKPVLKWKICRDTPHCQQKTCFQRFSEEFQWQASCQSLQALSILFKQQYSSLWMSVWQLFMKSMKQIRFEGSKEQYCDLPKQSFDSEAVICSFEAVRESFAVHTSEAFRASQETWSDSVHSFFPQKSSRELHQLLSSICSLSRCRLFCRLLSSCFWLWKYYIVSQKLATAGREVDSVERSSSFNSPTETDQTALSIINSISMNPVEAFVVKVCRDLL